MISYSVSLRSNPTDPEAAKKAYATAQVSDSLTIVQYGVGYSAFGSGSAFFFSSFTFFI